MKKKLLSFVLAGVLCLSTVGMNVKAAEIEEPVASEETVIEAETEDESTDEEAITSEAAETTQAIKIDENTFPDVNFRNYVLNKCNDGSGNLDLNAAAAVTTLTTSNFTKYVTDLTGIQYFTGLTKFQMEQCNSIKTLDLSNSKKLVNVVIDNCGALTSINLSGITTLKGTSSTPIQIYTNKNLTSLNLSGCTELVYLDLHDNDKMTSYDISSFTKLKVLRLQSNQALASLDVTKLTALTELRIDSTKIKSLDLSKNTKLTTLNCGGNLIEKLDLTNQKVLKDFSCTANLAIKSLEMNYLESNQTRLSLGGCNNLDDIKLHLLSKTTGTVTAKPLAVDGKNLVNKINVLNSNGDVQYYDSTQEIKFDPAKFFNRATGVGIYNLECTGIKSFQLIYTDYVGSDVTYVPVTSVSISNTTLSLKKGDTYTVTASVLPANATDKKIYWYIDDPSIIGTETFSSSGTITFKANAVGTTTLYAKSSHDEKIYATCTVTVTSDVIKGICQMPYGMVEPGQSGYLIGIETYPENATTVEMLILDCTTMKWVYTTGKCPVNSANQYCCWTVWQPQYGYYWTLFRAYDKNGKQIDELCYGFENI